MWSPSARRRRRHEGESEVAPQQSEVAAPNLDDSDDEDVSRGRPNLDGRDEEQDSDSALDEIEEDEVEDSASGGVGTPRRRKFTHSVLQWLDRMPPRQVQLL